MNCAFCEERISDYLEDALGAAERAIVESHMRSCSACNELVAGVREVVEWGRRFPVFEAPAWLPARILANTPLVARETWLDTLVSVGRWFLEPRTAMAILTSTLVLAWMGSLAGVSPTWIRIVRDPAAIYDQAQGLVNRAYDEAVRAYYRSSLVTAIQSRIEEFRESS